METANSFFGKFLGVFRRMYVFVREAKEELKKVTWPTRDQVTSFTIVVIITLIVISAFLWIVDTGLMILIQFVTK